MQAKDMSPKIQERQLFIVSLHLLLLFDNSTEFHFFMSQVTIFDICM